MAITDLYELTLFQSWGAGGEPLLNKFYFEKNVLGSNAQALTEQFVALNSYLTKINRLQGDLVKNVRIRTINLGDLADFYEDDLTGAGTGTGLDLLPAYVCINFTYKVNTRAVQPGSKRIAGIGETYQTNGIITDSNMIAYMEDARAAFATALPFGGVAQYTPCVIKRVKTAVPDTVPQKYRYTLPTSTDTPTVGIVTTVLVNPKLSHQVSRGNGR